LQELYIWIYCTYNLLSLTSFIWLTTWYTWSFNIIINSWKNYFSLSMWKDLRHDSWRIRNLISSILGELHNRWFVLDLLKILCSFFLLRDSVLDLLELLWFMLRVIIVSFGSSIQVHISLQFHQLKLVLYWYRESLLCEL
jgi:hypothetical protein